MRTRLWSRPMLVAPSTLMKEGCRAMIDSVTASLSRVGKRDIVIASVLTVLGLVLMYGNVHDQNADPAEFKKNTAVYFGGLVPVEFAIPLFLLVTVPLLWRRVAPLAAVGASLAGLGTRLPRRVGARSTSTG